jgi:hypothetical protein
MHDVIVVGIPLLAIMAGILMNRQDVNLLRGEIGGLRSELHSEVGSLRSELHSEIGGLRSEMNARFDSIQRDMREFYAELARHDTRIAVLEQNKR